MKRVEVEFVTPACAYVRKYLTGEMFTELGGRPPVWSSLARAWVTQPHVARDLLAVAESRGYDVGSVIGGLAPTANGHAERVRALNRLLLISRVAGSGSVVRQVLRGAVLRFYIQKGE